MTPVPPLNASLKVERISICDFILSYQYTQLSTLIFADLTTICEDLERGAIWRERVHHPLESFYTKEPKTCIAHNLGYWP